MAKLIISFDEMNGIGEFNKMPIYKSEPLIINKATDYINLGSSGHYIDEGEVKWNQCFADFVKREVVLILEI